MGDIILSLNFVRLTPQGGFIFLLFPVFGIDVATRGYRLVIKRKNDLKIPVWGSILKCFLFYLFSLVLNWNVCVCVCVTKYFSLTNVICEIRTCFIKLT